MGVIAYSMTFPLIIASSLAANCYGKGRPLRTELFQKEPTITVRQPDIADQDFAPRFRNFTQSRFHVACDKNLVTQMLQVQFDVSDGVFVIFDQEHSEGWHGRYGPGFFRNLLQL